MRNAFSKAIFELSKKNKDCALLVGNIGNKLFDDFKSENSDRFVNCGISEANMTGVAARIYWFNSKKYNKKNI